MMDIGSLFVILALIVLVVWFILHPFLDSHNRSRNNPAITHQVNSLETLSSFQQLGPELIAVYPQDDEIEVRIAERRRTRTDKFVGFCPSCGLPIQKLDQYCGRCGIRLTW